MRHVRPGSENYEILNHYYGLVHSDEKNFLKSTQPLIERQSLWNWCFNTSGLGYVTALTFHSYIRTHVHAEVGDTGVYRYVEINTAGKARKYFGLYPGARLSAREPGGFNPEAKGRLLGVIVKGIMMSRKGKGDSYYRPLYDAKKFFYANNSMYAPALKDPTLCPRFKSCNEKYLHKAMREGRKPKKPTCKGHIDNLTKRWIGGILVSHATQLIREGKGLDTLNFKSHRNYIRPKAFEDDTPDPEVLAQIRTGQTREYWKHPGTSHL